MSSQWYDNDCKVWVGNLPRMAKRWDLENFMRQVGVVEQACVLTDDGTELGKSRGSGWVIFSSRRAAAAAIEKLDQTEMMGRKIQVDRWWKNGKDDQPSKLPDSKSFPSFRIALAPPKEDTAKGGGLLKLDAKAASIVKAAPGPGIAGPSIFLVCIRIPAPIRARLQCLQDALVARAPESKICAVPVVRSHVALFVTRVESGQVGAAVAAFNAAGNMWQSEESSNRHRFNVMGLHHDSDSGSLVSKVLPPEPLERLKALVVEAFAREGFSQLGDSTGSSGNEHKVVLFKAPTKGGQESRDQVNKLVDLLTTARGTVDFGDAPLAFMHMVDLRAPPQKDGFYAVKAQVDLDVESAVEAALEESGDATIAAAAADDVTGGLFYSSLRWVLRDMAGGGGGGSNPAEDDSGERISKSCRGPSTADAPAVVESPASTQVPTAITSSTVAGRRLADASTVVEGPASSQVEAAVQSSTLPGNSSSERAVANSANSEVVPNNYTAQATTSAAVNGYPVATSGEWITVSL